MNEYVFFYRDNVNNQSRDCVAYLDINDLQNRHVNCDNCFIIHGANYSKSFNGEAPYENVTTILSKQEYDSLIRRGETKVDIQPIIEKLLSYENEVLFEQIVEEEKEYLCEEYSLSKDDVEEIFDNYSLDYRDRGIVYNVWNSIEDFGYDMAEAYDYIGGYDPISRYFDYVKFGEDLVEENDYYELKNGRIVGLNY